MRAKIQSFVVSDDTPDKIEMEFPDGNVYELSISEALTISAHLVTVVQGVIEHGNA